MRFFLWSVAIVLLVWSIMEIPFFSVLAALALLAAPWAFIWWAVDEAFD
jgi:hypothetical protein